MPKSKTIAKTSKKRAKTPSPRSGHVLPDAPKPFSAENQPTPEQKKEGWLKKKRGPELAKAVLQLAFQGMKNSELKKQAAEYYGIEESELTVELMLLFRQAEKAIQKADTPAFNAVMDRSYGKPKEKLEHSGPDDGPIETTYIPSPQAIEYSKIPLPLRLELLKHIRANKPKE